MGGLGSEHRLGKCLAWSVFFIGNFLPNFDVENMIPIYMKQYFIGGKFLPNFEKEEKFAMFPFFLKILAFAKF